MFGEADFSEGHLFVVDPGRVRDRPGVKQKRQSMMPAGRAAGAAISTEWQDGEYRPQRQHLAGWDLSGQGL